MMTNDLGKRICRTMVLALLIGPSCAAAQDSAESFDARETQRRVDICVEQEGWLQRPCLLAAMMPLFDEFSDGRERAVEEPPIPPGAPPEVQRRMDICRASEEWMQGVCFSGVMEMLHALHVEQRKRALGLLAFPKGPVLDPFDELHLVGVYEAGAARGEVPVHVDRPGRTVVLALTSFEPVRWMVDASDGTMISRIFLGGFQAPGSEVFLKGTKISPTMAELPPAERPEGVSFQQLHKAAIALTGAAHAASFNGAYKAPEDGFRIADAPGIPTMEETRAAMRAKAIPADTLPPRLRAALAGEPASDEWTFDKNGFSGVAEGQRRFFGVSPDVPPISWPAGAAHDPESQRLWGVSFGGEGHLYCYDIREGSWSAWSMQHNRAGGLIHDPEGNRLIATPGGRGPTRFVTLSETGEILSTLDVDYRDFPGLMLVVDPGSGFAPAFEPIAIGGGRILVRVNPDLPHGSRDIEDLVYLVNLETGRIDLVDAPVRRQEPKSYNFSRGERKE